MWHRIFNETYGLLSTLAKLKGDYGAVKKGKVGQRVGRRPARGATAGVWSLVTGTPRRASRTDQEIAVLLLRQSPSREGRRA